MCSMGLEEYLSSVPKLNHIAKEKWFDYESLRAAATSPGTLDYRRRPGRGTKAKSREDLIIRMLKAKDEYTQAKFKYIEARQEVFMYLIKLPINEASVLIYRYIKEIPYNKIPAEWEKDYNEKIVTRSVYRYIRSGKDHLAQILSQEGIINNE